MTPNGAIVFGLVIIAATILARDPAGLAVVLAPVTLLFGPVVAYNLAAVLLPALAAWTAFLLCQHVTGTFWPSVAGGCTRNMRGTVIQTSSIRRRTTSLPPSTVSTNLSAGRQSSLLQQGMPAVSLYLR